MVQNQNPSNGIYATEVYPSSETVLAGQSTSVPVVTGSQFRLILNGVGGTSWQCAEGNGSPFDAQPAAVSNLGAALGIHARGVGVELDYLYVVDYPVQ